MKRIWNLIQTPKNCVYIFVVVLVCPTEKSTNAQIGHKTVPQPFPQLFIKFCFIQQGASSLTLTQKDHNRKKKNLSLDLLLKIIKNDITTVDFDRIQSQLSSKLQWLYDKIVTREEIHRLCKLFLLFFPLIFLISITWPV